MYIWPVEKHLFGAAATRYAEQGICIDKSQWKFAGEM